MKFIIKLFFICLLAQSCVTEDEKINNQNITSEELNETDSKANNSYDFSIDEQEVLEMSKQFTGNHEWVLSQVRFLKIEDDPDANIKESVHQGLLAFEFYSIKDQTILKTGYFKFKKSDTSDQYILNSRFGDSCSGVNCSQCKLLNPWGHDPSCKCNQEGHPDGGPSYCNHSTGIIGILSPNLDGSDKKIIIQNPEEIISKVNILLRK